MHIFMHLIKLLFQCIANYFVFHVFFEVGIRKNFNGKFNLFYFKRTRYFINTYSKKFL
jgi:hypothetical protein